jgi:hypothetical protein
MRSFLILLALLIAFPVHAEPPVIFNGIYAKSIASGGFQHKSNRLLADCGATVPSAGAGMAAAIGSICQYSSGAAGTLYLKSGAANTAWVDILSAVTGVPAGRTINTTTPLQGGGNLSADRTFSITKSDTSTDGYLSSVDWNIFNDGAADATQALADAAAAQADIDAHIVDATGAHAGSAISNTPSGNLAATTVQGALNELQTENDSQATSITAAQTAADDAQADIDGHIADATAAHAASAISVTPSGNIVATDVQNALQEIQSDVDGRQVSGNYITELTGEVTASGPGSVAATIANDAVTNAKAANMAQSTIKGRAAGAGTGDPTDLTATQATAILDVMVGDSGSGGTKGLVPAPASGDAAANKYLKADGTWATVTGGSGSGGAQITMDSPNGFGSTNTAVRKDWTSRVANGGTAMTYSNSATDGAKVTINEDGVYCIQYHDAASGGTAIMGIVVNGTNGAGNVRLTSYAQGLRALGASAGANLSGSVSWCGYLSNNGGAADDYVWFQSSVGGADSTNYQAMFTIVKVN